MERGTMKRTAAIDKRARRWVCGAFNSNDTMNAWKAAVVAYFRLLSQHLPKGTWDLEQLRQSLG